MFDAASNATRPALTLGEGGSLYKQLVSLIAGRISTGVWKPGERLPSEPQLAAEFGVSISTVRAAVTELVRARALVRRQGRGTFISPRAEIGCDEYSFFRVYPNSRERELPRSNIVSFRAGLANDKDADRLRLGSNRSERRVFVLRNVLRMGEEIVQVSNIVLPERFFPGATRRKFEEAAPTLYGAYQALYGITVVRTEDHITAVAAPSDVASMLSQQDGAPVIRIQRVSSSIDGRRVDTRAVHIRTDAYHLLHVTGGTVAAG